MPPFKTQGNTKRALPAPVTSSAAATDGAAPRAGTSCSDFVGSSDIGATFLVKLSAIETQLQDHSQSDIKVQLRDLLSIKSQLATLEQKFATTTTSLANSIGEFRGAILDEQVSALDGRWLPN